MSGVSQSRGIVMVKTGTTYYHAQLGLPDKGCVIIELVFYGTFDRITMRILV